METPQIHEEEVAREEPPVQVDPRTGGPTGGGRVISGSSPPVQLEHSQRTRAPPSYLKDFFCDAVDNLPSVIIKEIWGDKQLRVAIPRYRETQL